jgi:predicted Ser/Thr protein kinase
MPSLPASRQVPVGDPPAGDTSTLASRWRAGTVLKRDVFSAVERGHFLHNGKEAAAVLRRIDEVPWWTRPIARHFLKREARALAKAGALGVAPTLLHAERTALVRGWIDGIALHIARPVGDATYFTSARKALRRIHAAGIAHNDLAKEQNWLRGADGHAYLTDFQLAMCFKRRNKLFRLAAYEDLRHLLKHKRRYLPDALTAAERRILARKTLPARIWLMTGKRVYLWITRGMLGFTDREGSGPRLIDDAPLVIERLMRHPAVRDAAVLPFPDRRAGTGLYAFVEAENTSEAELQTFLDDSLDKGKGPEHLQLVAALPRMGDGAVHKEALALIAMNQVDLLDSLPMTAAARPQVMHIVENRKNLRDRFTM